MSIENGKFYLITENGEFTSADAAEGFQIGDEVEIKKDMPSYMKPLASAAAAVLIMCGGVYGYHIPVRYVDVCINPEIQLSLNVLNRVVNVEAKNDDGEKIVASQNLKNDSVNKAIDEIVDSARSFGYMENGDEGERDVIVSVFGDGAYELSTKIPLDNVRVVDDADREKAEAENIPVGKYVLINELSKVDSEQSKKDAKDLSVKEIIDKINEAKSAPKPTPTPLPIATPEPTPTPVPTETPAATEAPVETEMPATVAKATSKTKSSSKVTTVASKNKAANKKTATVAKTSSGSSKNSTTTKTSTTAKTSTSKTTAKPTSAPVSVQVSAAPSKAPTATPLPSFNNVKRPSANNNADRATVDENATDTQKNEQFVIPEKTNGNPPSDKQNQSDNDKEHKASQQIAPTINDRANNKPTESAPSAETYSKPAESSKQNESRQPSPLQNQGDRKQQTPSDGNNAPSAPSGNANRGNNTSRPSDNTGNSDTPAFGNTGGSVPQQQSRPSGNNGGNNAPRQ